MSSSFPYSSPVESGSLPIQVQRLYLFRAFFSSFEKKNHFVVWCECGHACATHRVHAEVWGQLWAWVLIFPPWDGVSCSVSHTKLCGIADMCSHTRLHVILGVWAQGIMIAGESLLSKPSPEPLSFLEMGTLLCSLGWLWACGDPPASVFGIWVYLQACFIVPGFIVLLPKVFTLQMELRVR